MKVNKSLIAIFASALALGSCTDFLNDFDARSAKYDQEFEDVFGKIDPNQDWSMAGYYTAYVFGVQNGSVELYYSDPIAGKPVVVANRPVKDGEANFKFNAVKGTKRFYAKVKDSNGKVTLDGYFETDGDNVVAISPTFTRASIDETLSGASRVTKSDAYELACPQLLDWSKSSKFYLEESYKAGAIDYIDGYYADVEHKQSVAGKSDFYHEGTFTNMYMLYDVINDEDERPWWYVSDIAPFFETIDGNPGCFKESENHVVLMREGSNPKLEKDLVFTMDKEGQFYLDYFFKGTKFDNQFGYFYFTGNAPTREQFMTMPKYVLVDNMSTDGKAVHTKDANTTKTWDLLGNMSNVKGSKMGTGINGLSMAQNNWDTKIVGTRLYLTYFGADGTSEGSLNFPKGTKIGLFFIGNTDDNRVNKIITSISKLNLDLYNETPHAASFQLNDKVVFAMEDMNYGGDKDVNDAMFIAYGDFEKDEIPNIIPTVEPEGQTWIMACEDLGGSYDYDFNDLVFGLRMTDNGDGTSNLDLVPLAAGGTLDAQIKYDGKVIGEIHQLVDPSATSLTQLNVEPGSSPEAGQTIRLASGIDSETKITDIASKVQIIVTNESAITDSERKYNIGYDKSEDHEAPQVLLLPAGWDWPSEETLITDIYPEFKNWASSSTDPDAQTWCNTKKEGATAFANNPVRPVVPSTDPEDPGQSGGGQGGSPTTPTAEWNITITGEPAMSFNSSQTITINVEGLEDYSDVVCGTYSSNVFTATKVSDTQYTIATANSTVRGSGRFYVLVPGDATHATTRKIFEITVGAAVPEFYIKSGGKRITSGKLTLDVNPVNINLDLEIEVVKADGNAITWESSDESIVKIENNSPKRVACGTVTITATHSAVEDSNNEFVKKSISIELTIAKIDPELVVSPSTMQIGENETKAFTVSNSSGSNSYTITSSDETVAQVTTLNGGYAIKGLKKGNATITVTHNATAFYKESSKQIEVTVSESQLDPWTITVSPEVPTSMIAGETKEFTISVAGEQWDRTGITYSTNSLLTAVKNGFTVKLTAGNTAGEGTFTITYPGDNETHKTTSKEYTINVVVPTSTEYPLTSSSMDGNMYVYGIPSEIVWNNVTKVELYFEDEGGANRNVIVGSETLWDKKSGVYHDVTSNFKTAAPTTFQIGNQWSATTISNVKLKVTSTPSSAKRRSTSKAIRRK